MGESFKLTILGQAKWILGMRVSYKPNGTIQIDQEKYLLEVLKRFGMENTKPYAIPAIADECRTGNKLSTNQGEYMSLIGSLIYLTTVMRPDVSFTISKAGRAMANLTQLDMVAAKRILRYLCGTPSRGITYGPNESRKIEGYADSCTLPDLQKIHFLSCAHLLWLVLHKASRFPS